MGAFFTALLVREYPIKDQNTIDNLNTIFDKAGYTPAKTTKKAEAKLTLYQTDKNWQIIFGEYNILHSLAKTIADQNKTKVILFTCVDSDFMEYTLFDGVNHIQTEALIGESYDESPPPMIEQEIWQQAAYTEKIIDFAAIFRKEYLFAEESLNDLGEALGFDGTTVMNAVNNDCVPDLSLYYTLKKDEFYKTEGAPEIVLRSWDPSPIKPDHGFFFCFENMGGPGKGIEVFIYGPFVENEALTFSKACLRHNDLTYNPDSIRKEKLNNGTDWYAYIFSFPNVELSGGFKLNAFNNHIYAQLSDKLEWSFLSYCKGDARYGLDVYFAVIPLSPGGKGFKKTNCGVDNHKKYIEEHNSRVRIEENKLRMEDYEY